VAESAGDNVKTMTEFTQVTEEEFKTFLNEYPKSKLEWNCTGICEPPIGTYNDFSLGDWPESIVAKINMFDGSEYHGYKQKEYFIAE
jgi:hypothetical protein